MYSTGCGSTYIGGGGRLLGSKMSNNELEEDMYSTAMELGERKLSYQVLESHLKCNQGTKNVSSIPVHTCTVL